MIIEADAQSCYIDCGRPFWREPFSHYTCKAFNDAVLHVITRRLRIRRRGAALVMASAYPAEAYIQEPVESHGDFLIYTSDRLTEDLGMTGRVSAAIFASTDGIAADWVVRLCDVDKIGCSLNIVDGITHIATESGRVDETETDVWSASIVIRTGHRPRVHVTSSNFPRWDRNLTTVNPPPPISEWPNRVPSTTPRGAHALSCRSFLADHRPPTTEKP